MGCRTASIQSQPTITTAERIDESEKSGSATRCRLPNPIDLELVIERNGVQQPGNINKDKVAGTDCSGTARPLETALECKLEVFCCFFFVFQHPRTKEDHHHQNNNNHHRNNSTIEIKQKEYVAHRHSQDSLAFCSFLFLLIDYFRIEFDIDFELLLVFFFVDFKLLLDSKCVWCVVVSIRFMWCQNQCDKTL